MTEIQEMQNQIAQLQQETLALKSKSKVQALRQRFAFGLAIVGIGVALMTHNGNTQATVQNQTIVCRYLKVVDAKGNTVVTLSATKDREGHIGVYNSSTNRIVAISATTDTGEGGIWIADQKGINRASLRSQGGKGILWTQK